LRDSDYTGQGPKVKRIDRVYSPQMTLLLVLALAVQDPTPRALVERLRSENAVEREDAARKLQALGKAAVPDLEKAAKDPEIEVSARARRLLRIIALAEKLTPALRTGFPGIEERLVNDDDSWTTEFLKVAEAASTRPDVGAADLEVLIGPALLHAGDDHRVRLIEEVERWSLGSAAPALKAYLLDGERPGDKEAGDVLARLAPRALGPELLEIFRGPHERARFWIIPALRAIGNAEAVPDLLKTVESAERNQRKAAIRTLGEWGRAEAVPVLLKQLGEADEPDVVDALGRIGDARAIPAILTAMKSSPYPSTRLWGSDSLVRLDAKEAVPILIDQIGLPKSPFRNEVLRALRYLSPDDARKMAERLFDSPKPGDRQDGVAQFGLLKATDKVEAIAALLDHSDAGLRATAMRTLVRLKARDQVDRIALRMAVPEDVRTAAAALADLGAAGKADRTKIVAQLQSADPWIVYGAIETLGKVGAKDRVPELLPFLKSENYFHREAAATAIGRLAGKQSLEPLRPLLRDPNCAVRYYAATALCDAGLIEGAATLLKETRDRQNPHKFDGYTSSDTRTCRILNSFRQPKEWAKVVAAPLPPLPPGSRRAQVETIARELGFKVEWPEGPDHAWFTARAVFELFEPPTTSLDGLIHLLQGSRILGEPPLFEFVLEADRIRVLHYLDAIRFWERWLPR